MLRLAITLVTVVMLAFAAQGTLSVLLSPDPREGNSIAIEAFENNTSSESHGRLFLDSVLADGRVLDWDIASQIVGWEQVAGRESPTPILRKLNSIHAALNFKARRFLAVFRANDWYGSIRISRNGAPLRTIDVKSSGQPEHFITVEDPVVFPSTLILVAAGACFGLCALWFAPIRAHRASVPWLVFFLSALHLLYWAGQSIGFSEDSRVYVRTVPEVFSAGIPAYFPPGYPALIALIGEIAGGNLGTWLTLLQHGMTVCGAVWLYLLLGRFISDQLALAGSVLAGALATPLMMAQAVMSEAATFFAMAGTLYFCVRAVETGKLRFMAIAGFLIGWSATLRVVPLAALFPAILLLYYFSSKNSFRLSFVTTTIAAITILLPVSWFFYKSGRPILSSSTGLHLFNRVVHEQKLLDSNGPATRQLLSLLPNQDPREFHHWEITEQSGLRKLPYDQKELLLRTVSLEAFYKYPCSFLTYTLQLASRIFLASPVYGTPTWGFPPGINPAIENVPPLGPTAASLSWRLTAERFQIFIWPTIFWAAIAGVLIELLTRRRMVLLALAWVPFGYLVATASLESFDPRYNTVVAPFWAMLAILPLEFVLRAAQRFLPSPVSSPRVFGIPQQPYQMRAANDDSSAGPPKMWIGLAIVMLGALAVAATFLHDFTVFDSRTVQWLGGTVLHPVLGAYYQPNSSARTVYPDNPRHYFDEPDSYERRWLLDIHDPGSEAKLTFMQGSPRTLTVEVTRAGKPELWHVQLREPGLALQKTTYELAFRARANATRTIVAGISQGHGPWKNLGLFRQVDLGPEWKEFKQTFVPSSSDQNAQIHLDVGAATTPVEFSEVTLRRLSDGAVIEPALLPEYSVSYRFNHLGCRGNDYAIPRPDNHRRILVIGGSFALGVGVHEPDTFEARLEQSLNGSQKDSSARAYDVINCGVNGYNTQQQRLFYELIGSRYQPDTVLLVMAPDDDRSWPERFYTLNVKEVLKLQDECVRDHARLVIALFRNAPLAGNWANLVSTVSGSLEHKGIPMIDLGVDLMREHNVPELAVDTRYDADPNEIAHASAAGQIERFLRREGLFGGEPRTPAVERKSEFR